MLILQINWSADAGQGLGACGAHSHQPPSLITFDEQFPLKCLFFRSTGAQTQAKGAARVAHTPSSPLVLVPLINSFYWNAYSSDQLKSDAGKGRRACGAHSHQPSCLSTFDKQFLLKCPFFRSTGAQTQAKGAARVAHTPTSPLVTRPVVTADPGSKVIRAPIVLRVFCPCPHLFY
jgi:hypothetical protein